MVRSFVFFGPNMYIYLLAVHTILFMVPISSFDQRLVEDPRLYCLEDSMHQWRKICRNRLLANIDLILCFNDLDILQRKLEAGIQFNSYLTRYDGPNTLFDVCRCEWLFSLPRVLARRGELEWNVTHANGLIDIESVFIAIHREGLKGQFIVPVKNGDRVNDLPGEERRLRVHHIHVMDMGMTFIREIIFEGTPFLGSLERYLLKMCIINSEKFNN